jgi:hypothetical protein
MGASTLSAFASEAEIDPIVTLSTAQSAEVGCD